MANLSRTPEQAFYDAIEAVLVDAGGTASIAYIRRRIPRYLSLTGADCLPSPTRPGEQLWEQQVRNIVCHRDCENNPIKIGKFVYSRGRLALAQTGQGDLFDNDD